jgi:hypothetical protein
VRVPARRALLLSAVLSAGLGAGAVLLVVDRSGPGSGPDEPASAVALRVSTTSEGLTDRDGDRWAAAEGFVGGTRTDAAPDQLIVGAEEPRLYASQQWGMAPFQAPLADGPYDVTLHLADTYFDQPAQRVFDVYAEGLPAAEDVDIVAEVGPDTAWDLTFPVDVTGGRLDLEFFTGVDHPTVGAVSAVPVRAGAGPVTRPARGLHQLAVGRVRTGGGGRLVRHLARDAGRGGRDLGGERVLHDGAAPAAAGRSVRRLGGRPGPGRRGALEGETWSDAAAGRLDERWETSLTELARVRGDAPGTTYIRFAHEMNGNWYPWAVQPTETADFQTAWSRFRALQEQLLPDAQLVFCVNRETAVGGLDWRELFPGADQVDVLSVDYYNNFPYVDTAQAWKASLEDVDAQGAPKGLEAHRRFAEQAGLPLAVSEWSGMAGQGDSPAFIEGMHAFFEEHAGNGAGDLLYEVQFNEVMSDRQFVLFPAHDMPDSSVTYRDLW